jgi:hypothetical protein
MTLEEPAQVTVCVSAGSSALPCNEYALWAQQNPKGPAPPVAASILRCVEPFRVWLLYLL